MMRNKWTQPTPRPADAQCGVECSACEDYEEVIQAGGVLCEGCGRKRPNEYYRLMVGDWRIGMAATPKMRDHDFYKYIGIIRGVVPETPNSKEQLRIELWVQGVGRSRTLVEPSDDWMTA